VVRDTADALDLAPSAVRVAVQERPRHEDLVAALRDAGAQVRLFGEGDLSFALLALRPRGAGATPRRADAPIDLLWGIGGAPEGMLAAAAQRVLGGAMRLRPSPRSEAERRRLAEAPALPDDVLTRPFAAADLVRTESVAMALTGVTDGPLLDGVADDAVQRTDTLVLSPARGARRVPTTGA
jgi:fructose-1,6-bisphosphatase II